MAVSGCSYRRDYPPSEFIEGYRKSKVWIIGLNPKEEPTRSRSELAKRFDDPTKLHPYFKDFRTVSQTLYDLLGKEEGVAHTDLVRCHSPSWPPPGVKSAEERTIIENCSPYLVSQIRSLKPQLLICNGSKVSSFIKEIVKPPDNETGCTSYSGRFEGKTIHVILSGFVGRLDNYAKWRLGREIEHCLRRILSKA